MTPVDYNFHYDRSERLKLTGHTESSESGTTHGENWFARMRKNKGLMITLVDLLIIVLLAGVILPMARSTAKREQIEGYNILLSGMVYDGRVLVSLRFTPEESATPLTLEDIRIFLTEDDPWITDFSLEPTETELRLRGTLTYKEGKKTIQADIPYQGKNYRLTAPLTFE